MWQEEAAVSNGTVSSCSRPLKQARAKHFYCFNRELKSTVSDEKSERVEVDTEEANEEQSFGYQQ